MSLSDLIELLQLLDSEIYYYLDKFGVYIYFILFAVVFGKTGFVVLTFLPGDSLVFACGTLAAVNHLNFIILFCLFFIATSLADSNNYSIGRTLKKIPHNKSHFLKLLPEQTINKASQFLYDYGRVAITFSRFIPLMRTMTPFIAGFTGYHYKNFVQFNVLGAFIWTSIWLGTGYLLGNIRWVEENLLLTFTFITMIMLIPSIYGFLLRFRKNKQKKRASHFS